MNKHTRNKLAELAKEFPCRDVQIKQLSCLLNTHSAPPVVVVYGLEATGKSTIVQAQLSASQLPHAIIRSQECITTRHLLEKTLSACVETLGIRNAGEKLLYSKCESVSTLASQLQVLLQKSECFFLVFDGIDRQREATSLLLPALARFNELVPSLTIVLIVSQPHQRFLHKTGIPHVYFPSYGKDEVILIVSRSPLPIFTELPLNSNYSEEEHAEDSQWLWSRFCSALWDSMAKSTGCDIISFQNLAKKMWPLFVSSIVDGTFGTRDFSRLVVAKRGLFQSEEIIVDRIVSKDSHDTRSANNQLSYNSKWLLCAAYLASYNPPRMDPIFFMKSTEKKRKKKNAQISTGQASKIRKVPRRLLAPAPFPLSRLIAIFNSIVPHQLNMTVDIYTQISTLTSLRLLVRGGLSADVLDPSAKWRVNIGWEMAQAIGRSIGFEIAELLFEQL